MSTQPCKNPRAAGVFTHIDNAMFKPNVQRFLTLVLLLFVAWVWFIGDGATRLRDAADRLDTTISRTDRTPPGVTATPKQLAEARKSLTTLRVAPAGSMAGYDRDQFKHWSDLDRDGCDSREETIRLDATKVTGKSGCATTGVWLDPYGGERFTNPRDLDIDHIVPLANAWRSGADDWNAGRRQQFANDPSNLLAVSASLNRQKGDKGPEAWKPPNQGYRATYAAAWIRIKAKYGLSVTTSEKQALQGMLG